MAEVKTVSLKAGANRLRKKIRDLERLQRRSNLNAEKSIEVERALKTLKDELKGVQADAKKIRISNKYKMVRFFENKKAIRRLKQASKKGKDSSEYRKALLDYLYVTHFPTDDKYLAIFAAETLSARSLQFRKQLEEKLDKDEIDLSKLPV